MDVVALPPLVQLLVLFCVISLTAGSAVGVALGTLIRRADRLHREEIALLVRARALG